MRPVVRRTGALFNLDIITNAPSFRSANKGMRRYAHAITENHPHPTATAPHLSRIVREFKNPTAREIVVD
ncbi:MAG: hypothetical protein IT367_07760 [Candidatus Hydrogenedentes bacterium]|nr:hypothetical protein [Candidatus Hydrogenedentota bacterium]